MKWFEHRMITASFVILVFFTAVTLFAQDESGSAAPNAGAAKTKARPADPLAQQVDEAIEITTRRYLTANVHTPWQILHGILALRRDFLLKRDGKKVSAIEWLSHGARFRGEHMFEATRYGGRAHPYSQPYAFEGHPNQFLAILTMSNLPLDHQFKTATGTISVADIVNNAKMEINDREEITWSLWALCHYLPADARWTNKYGVHWSIERMVQIQTYDSVNDAACGGTHGLFALSYARKRYLRTKRPLRGVWLQADQKIQRYVASARSLQNYDGSFSATYFRGRSHTSDFTDRIATSGHMLEWLMMALPERRLKEDWVRRGVAAIANDLIVHRGEPVECGPLYHALDALILYREKTRPKEVQIAKQTKKQVAQSIVRTQQQATKKTDTKGSVQEPSESQTVTESGTE